MNAPTSLKIRAYNVGFGDCLLLRFGYAAGRDRTMLVDFGTTAGPRNDRITMRMVADRIAEDCGGALDVVVATHRHADHISGFAGATGRVIAGLDPGLVVQPWTEDPGIAPDAVAPSAAADADHRGVAARLVGMQELAAAVVREVARRKGAGEKGEALDDLAFVGDVNLSNAKAVRALSTLGRARVYLSAGDTVAVDDLLPGVRIDVLGPPTLAQVPGLADAARRDEDEFWHLAATTGVGTPGRAPRVFLDARRLREVPQQARWVVPRIERLRTEELFSIVRRIDDALNNTSLILLVEVGGTRVLLPGDAQLENWSWALRDAPDADATRARLADCRVYKVGHHGSLNATPKAMLWPGFGAGHRPPDRRLITVLSTREGKHGNPRVDTEVPRDTLVEELERVTDLLDTRSAGRQDRFWVDTPGLPL